MKQVSLKENHTYSVEDAEQFATRVNPPGLQVPLKESGYDKKLNNPKETRVRGDRQTGRVFFKNRSLQNKPPGPRQAMPDEENATQSPIFGLCIAE